MQNHIYVPKFGTLKGTIFIIAVAVALCVGLSLAAPAHGASARQDAQGDISGTVTLNNQGAAGVTVELRQRNNGGEDVVLVSAKSDTNGMYHFANQPSAPNDAFYYVRFLGTNGSLAVWYSFPIIYISGSQISVPAVELSDVELASPAQNATVQLPTTLKWKARKTGETYRVFVYADGKTDKPLLDSGSLGTNTEYTVGEGGLADGKYEAVVQVRDTVVGYGQSQSRFRFSVGAAPVQAPTQAPAEGNTTTPQVVPGTTQGAQDTPAQQGSTAAPPVQADNGQPSSTDDGSGAQAPAQTPAQQPEAAPAGKPEVKVNLSADKVTAAPGDSMLYTLEVLNTGNGTASGVVLTDQLPAGVSVDSSKVQSTSGQVSVENGTVTVNIGDLGPGAKASVSVPVAVKPEAGSNVSNQATANYSGAPEPVLSNAYIAQVAEPLSGAGQQPAQAPAQAPAQQPAQQPQQAPAQAPAQQPAQAAASGQQGSAPAAPSGSKPSAPQQAPASRPQNQPAQSAPKSAAGSGTQSKAEAPAKKPAAAMPQTGGSFPVLLAVLLVVATLLARYLRGLTYRRI